MGKKLRNTSGGSAENCDVYLFRNMGSFETIFVDDTSQVKSHSVAKPTRKPNILRGSNARAFKNYKTPDKNDVSNVEDANTSFDLNLLSDSESGGKYNKVLSPKSHHQRKQVHYPLDVRYDVPNWNNNINNNNNNNNYNNYNKKDKDPLQVNDELEALCASLSHKKDTLTKKINDKHNSKRRRRLFKKSPQTATGKSNGKRTVKLSGFDSSSIVVANANALGSVAAQSVACNNFLDDDVTTLDVIEVETRSDEWPNIFHRDNDIYGPKENKVNCNTVVSGKETQERGVMQRDLLNYEFAVEENDSMEENSISKNNRSNFLLASEVLCTCACANCTTCDKDLVLHEDCVPSCVNSDAETGLCSSYVYDLYPSDYYHVLGDVDGFDNLLSCEVLEDTSVMKNACDGYDFGNCGTARLNESNVSTLDTEASTPVKLCELKNSQIVYEIETDRSQESFVKPSPTELFTFLDESRRPLEVERVSDLYLDSEDFSMEVNETTSQNQDTASTNAPVSVLKKPYKRKRDLCVIQCTQCNRLFSKKKFTKHFTHCTFYKEDFKCHVCSKIYRYKSSLVQHQKTMHNMSNKVYENYFICNKCNKSYVRFRAFQRHLLVHDNC